MSSSVTKSIKAVIFDLSGTIIDFGCKSQIQAFIKLFDKHNITITESDLKTPMATKFDYIKHLFNQEKIRNQYLRKHHTELNDEIYQKFCLELENLLEEEVVNNGAYIPGVEKTIEILKNKNIKIAATTGYSRPLISKLIAKNFRKDFFPEIIVTPNEVKFGRPYPYMINQIAEKLEIMNPESIIKLGDTDIDIEEARNANVWAGAVVDSSYMMHLSEKELAGISANDLNSRRVSIENYYREKKADFVIGNISQLSNEIDALNHRLNDGDFPGNKIEFPQQKYLLYTPGPLTTSKRVKMPLLLDHGSRETEYMETVQEIRRELVKIALNDTYGRDAKKKCTSTNNSNINLEKQYSTVIIQGSGTFAVEATVASVIPKTGKLLVIINGAYGQRMQQIAKTYNINNIGLTYDENEIPNIQEIDSLLSKDKDITHVGVIHSETTTGILNPLEDLSKVIKSHNKVFIVDAMSSFGAVPLDINRLGIDYLVSSANKNIQGVPGFAYVIANTNDLIKLKDVNNYPRRTVSLDVMDQWEYLEKSKGGFRFTSPVHTLMSFKEAIKELYDEGGVDARFERYWGLQKRLVDGMGEIGFKPFDLKGYQGPIITTFHSPKCTKYNFNKFYEELKKKRCVIYPGKLTKADSFRIGTIGNLFLNDIDNLVLQVKETMFWDNRV